jgi:hypothetical protein
VEVRKTDVNLSRAAVCIGFVIGLTACNGTEEPVSPGLSLAEDAQAVTLEKKTSGAPMSLNEQIKFAKEELAKRLGIDPETITLTGARQVNWRSGALGCPDQGMNYTQALVPGILILLNVDDKSFGYHAKSDGKPFYCPRGRVEAPASIQAKDLA